MLEIYIDNFRSFIKQKLELDRVNILIGENSGGKSSFLKFLLSLKQSLETPEISNLILRGSHTDLGSFKEVIYKHNKNLSLNFGFNFKNELRNFYTLFFNEKEWKVIRKNKDSLKTINNALKKDTYVEFSINKNLDIHEDIKTKFSNEVLGELEIIFPLIDINFNSGYEAFIYNKTCSLIYYSKIRNKKITLSNIRYNKKSFLSIIDGLHLNFYCLNKLNDINIFYELAVFLINQNLIEHYLISINYLNPLSSKPERVYINSDPQTSYRTSNLENFTTKITNKRIKRADVRRFIKKLAEFGIADDMQLIMPKELPVTELRIKIKDLSSNICDVGYGVALQIPLLFEAFISEEYSSGDLFLIEQPEVHLHPKLQSRFIETLLSFGNKNTYIIETHSEYIVRKLQVLVKEKKFDLKPNNIKINYFTRNNDKFEITTHPISKDGHFLLKFPEGFYDNSYSLTKALMF